MIINSVDYIARNVIELPIDTVKSQIVIGSTLRSKDNHLKHLSLIDTVDVYPTYTITRDGVVYQHYDPTRNYTNFINTPTIKNNNIISVVLENMCYLKRVDNNYINYIGEYCEPDRVAEFKWQGFYYWELYSDTQMESLVKLCSMLCDEHDITKQVIDFTFFHKNIDVFNGVCFRSNHILKSTDNNPMFDVEYLIENLI
jgi:hypothetical protein